jgi:hypothetical protein
MVPMHGFTTEEALHEPRVWGPGFSRLGVPSRFTVSMHDFSEWSNQIRSFEKAV